MPTPVIIMKDVGGLVRDYQTQTEFYRLSNREVRLHECRSACTLALSLPNVCVYPNSLLKFHLAYNQRTKQSDYGVSQELFQSYPPAVQARLGGLTRGYKVLAGAELIKLGVRDCNEPVRPAPTAPEPRIMVAKAVQRPVDGETSLSSLWHTVTSVFGETLEQKNLGREYAALPHHPAKPAHPPSSEDQPLPPARPSELLAQPAEDNATKPDQQDAILAARDPTDAGGLPTDAPLPPVRPLSMQVAMTQQLAPVPWQKLMTGAQPILPEHFTAYPKLSLR
jgi:hypothetical protein